jgi:hypothetical protein
VLAGEFRAGTEQLLVGGSGRKGGRKARKEGRRTEWVKSLEFRLESRGGDWACKTVFRGLYFKLSLQFRSVWSLWESHGYSGRGP